MAANYAKHVSTKQGTPQSEQADPKQVLNSAGAYSFAVDKWVRLNRFLVLGSDGGTYYATEKTLTKENADCILDCANEDGKRTVEIIKQVSMLGRAPKNDPAIFALALCTTVPAAREFAYAAVNDVCRIGTHIFMFTDFCNTLRGWGRGLRQAVANWYTQQSTKDLAFQVTKYQQRNGWSHRDLLRLSHPTPTEALAPVLHWCVKGWDSVGEQPHDNPALLPIWAMERAKVTTSLNEIIALITEYCLPRECIPTIWLREPGVWEALLVKMPIHALVRNLATMTRIGLLTQLSAATKTVCHKLADNDLLRRSRLHPIAVLTALLTYKSGRSVKGDSTWSPLPRILDALDGAFYGTFENVLPTNKNILLALDVSGSMDGGTLAGVPGLTPRIAAAAMAMVTARCEPNHQFVAFTSGAYKSQWSRSHGLGSGITELTISPRQRLNDVVVEMRKLPFGGTDCALPMLWALDRKESYDGFIVLTDCETWAGDIHPHEALRRYRSRKSPGAKLIVEGMISNNFTIADPGDAGMLDVVGFDTATPQLISDFLIQ